jgi:hypothetical protein
MTAWSPRVGRPCVAAAHWVARLHSSQPVSERSRGEEPAFPRPRCLSRRKRKSALKIRSFLTPACAVHIRCIAFWSVPVASTRMRSLCAPAPVRADASAAFRRRRCTGTLCNRPNHSAPQRPFTDGMTSADVQRPAPCTPMAWQRKPCAVERSGASSTAPGRPSMATCPRAHSGKA